MVCLLILIYMLLLMLIYYVSDMRHMHIYRHAFSPHMRINGVPFDPHILATFDAHILHVSWNIHKIHEHLPVCV